MLETKIDCVDYLAQLDEEVVSFYEAVDETVTTIVTALFAMQLNTVPITLGTIEPVVTRSIKIEDQQDSILGVITKLRETVGGYFEVNTSRQFNWWNDIGEDKGQQIRYKKNIKGLSRMLEFTNFGNRLYCYGAGEGSARITLSEVQAEDYVEDVPSQNTYGMCIRQLTDKSITDPDVLLAWANLKLAEMKDPRAAYRVDMVNLAAMGWEFEALQLGSIVKVIDEDLGIDIQARIVKITHDLSNPENIQVEISNVTKDFIDTFSGVYDTQQFYDHIATKIGAGQVTVLGAFTVQDWVTGGTTKIIGDYIRSGTLESNNWAAGAGSQFNLNDGTFKLGGSAAPKLSWNGVTLAIDGYVTVGNAIAPGGAAADVNSHVTTISGGKVKTGNLESTNWAAGAGSQFNLDDGTFKLGGSASPKLSWNGTTLTVQGTIYATAGEFTGTLKVTNVEAGKTLTINGTISAAGGAVVIDSTAMKLYSVAGITNNKLIIYRPAGGSRLFVGWEDNTYAYIYAERSLVLSGAGGIHNLLLEGGFVQVNSTILRSAAAAYTSLGDASYYFDVINYKTLTDRGCPMPTFKSHTEAIMNMKTRKRKLTIAEAKREGMGSRAIERIQKRGIEIEEFDLDNFPEDYLDIPTQKNWDDAEKDYQERLKEAKDPSKVIKYEPKRGYCLNEIVYSLVKSQQEIIERLKVLEAK